METPRYGNLANAISAALEEGVYEHTFLFCQEPVKLSHSALVEKLCQFSDDRKLKENMQTIESPEFQVTFSIRPIPPKVLQITGASVTQVVISFYSDSDYRESLLLRGY